jgi:hypothetical protein
VGTLEAANTPQTRQYFMEDVEIAVDKFDVETSLDEATDDDCDVGGLGNMGGTTGITAGIISE